jgi:flavorubredoxin
MAMETFTEIKKAIYNTPEHKVIFFEELTPASNGKEMVERFINWVENLQVGVDLLTQDRYRVPV